MPNRRNQQQVVAAPVDVNEPAEFTQPFRVRRVPLMKLEDELNACVAHGYKILDIRYPELEFDEGHVDGVTMGPPAVVLSKRGEDANAKFDLPWLMEIATDASKLKCLSAPALVDDQDCEDCVACRARAWVESHGGEVEAAIEDSLAEYVQTSAEEADPL